MFGNLGFWEIAVIAGLALLFFGPKGIPEMGRHLGQFWRFVQKGQNEIKQAMQLDPELQEASRHDPRGTKRPAAPPHAVSRGGEGAEPAADEAVQPSLESAEELPEVLLGTAPGERDREAPGAGDRGAEEAAPETPGAEEAGPEKSDSEKVATGRRKRAAGTPG